MLILHRRTNQSIVIGDNIEITVVGIRGDTARIGIQAPPEIPVDRLEVAESKRIHGMFKRQAAEGKASIAVSANQLEEVGIHSDNLELKTSEKPVADSGATTRAARRRSRFNI